MDQSCRQEDGCGTVGDVQPRLPIRQATLQYSNTMYLIQMSLYAAVLLFSSRSDPLNPIPDVPITEALQEWEPEALLGAYGD
jgi:hypothetical protein